MTTDSIPQKHCKDCGREFPATSEYFPPYKVKQYSYLRHLCRECWRKGRKVHNDDTREADRERRANWRGENPDKVKAQKKRSHSRHRDHDNARSSRWYEEHKDEQSEKRKQEYAANPLPTIERAKAYYQANKEERKAYIKQWQADNPDKMKEYRIKGYLRLTSEQRRASNHKRRARIRAVGGAFTKEDLKLQYKSQRGKCWHCGKPLNGLYHADHLYPIDRGGSNNARNIVCSCPDCNWSKGHKPTWLWNGRLL